MFAASLLAGMGVSAGTFAFIIIIGIIPRVLRKCKLTNVLLIENFIIVGAILGNVISLFPNQLVFLPYGIEHMMVIIYGLSTGIFVGCMSVALAEILHTFPVVFRRLKLKTGLTAVVYAMALGKMVGAMYYFVMGYFITA